MDDLGDAGGLPAIVAELHRLAEAVERLSDDVGELVARSRLSHDEQRLLAAILPAVAATTRGAAFAAAEVLDIPSIAAAVDGHSASQLAWLLGRARGRRIGRCRVDDAGRDRTGRLWSVTTR